MSEAIQPPSALRVTSILSTATGPNRPKAQAPSTVQAAQAAGVEPPLDAFDAGSDDHAARLAVAALDAPFLPDVTGPMAPRGEAAGVALDGLAYRQRRLAEAIHILTELAGARMDAVGRAKVRYARSEVTAALQAAELELQAVKAGRRAMWISSGASLLETGSTFAKDDPKWGIGLALLGKGINVLDKHYGAQRTVDDASWEKNYINLRERLSKQMEDAHGNEYEKAIRLLERSLETTRQMATNNTDTLRSVSQNM